MGREEDLWDDAALINAFNDALSKHKMMHSQGGNISLSEEGKILDSTEENKFTLNDQNQEARCSEKDDKSNTTPHMPMEMGETALPIRENQNVVSGDPDKNRPFLDGQNIQEEQTGFLNSQSLEDYNQLLSKYYELEDQRQKVLQQLNQYGYWDYQNPNTTASNYHNIGPATFASQEHQGFATQSSYPTVACSCCPYGCQTLVAPCPSLPASGLGAVCVDETGNTTFRVEGKEKAVEINMDHTGKSSCSDTDLNVVMNAWYTAGFYTGKYLAEQKRQG